MEKNNQNFIKGGLPLGSGDFVNPENARESKSKLLAALDNINKVHEEKMGSIVDNSEISNKLNVNMAIDMAQESVSQDNYYNPQDFANNQFVPYENNTDQSNSYIPAGDFQFENPNPVSPDGFENFDMDTSQAVEYENEPQPEENVVSPETFDQGEPMYIMDEKEIGKRGKGKFKAKGNTIASDQIKSGKGVAWLAYILFFIPLLLKGKNAFVRHHANEGLCINIIDVIGLVLFFVGDKVSVANKWAEVALTLTMVVGIAIIALTTITKLSLIIMTLFGKEANNPFIKARIIK